MSRRHPALAAVALAGGRTGGAAAFGHGGGAPARRWADRDLSAPGAPDPRTPPGAAGAARRGGASPGRNKAP